MVSFVLAVLVASEAPQNQAPLVAKDARITVDFVAKSPDGTVIADTIRRGMAFTFLMDQDTVAPFWHASVRGLRQGESRQVKVRASEAGVALDGDPTLSVTVTVVKVAPL